MTQIYRHIPKILFTGLLLAFLAGSAFPAPANAQSIEVIDDGVEYEYGKFVRFRAHLVPVRLVEKVLISFRSSGDDHTQVYEADVGRDGLLTFTYEHEPSPLRAFTTVEYRFTVLLRNREKIESETFSFFYDDNRFDWESLERDTVAVRWYDGDSELGENIIDTLHQGLDHARSFLDVAMPERLLINVYASSNDLMGVLRPNGNEWIVGHAEPGLDVIVVALPPGPDQRLLTEQRIPHELMHVLLYQKAGAGYANIPAWLNEGLASMAELYPDPDYQILLENAVREDRLIPLASLCQSFPNDTIGLPLAYAESTYFTRYLYRQYGSSSLETLLAGYVDGLSCQRGIEAAYGNTLEGLESEWKVAAFGSSATPKVDLQELLPWLVVLSAVLLLPLAVTIASLRSKQ